MTSMPFGGSSPKTAGTLPKFPNYAIVYRPDTAPLQMVAVLHGKRDLKKILQGRS